MNETGLKNGGRLYYKMTSDDAFDGHIVKGGITVEVRDIPAIKDLFQMAEEISSDMDDWSNDLKEKVMHYGKTPKGRSDHISRQTRKVCPK